jgi:EAL domain-containing protein (putative c-di-GMP-specific phosphodiesterase class I)
VGQRIRTPGKETAMRHDQLSIESDLVGAVERSEIVPYYQSQFDIASGAIVGVEALCRWQHPRDGLLAPDLFIEVAERSNLIHEIGDFMLDRSCRCAARWETLGHPIEVSVNVSAVQLADPSFFDRLMANLDDFALEPRLLTVEITESVEITDRDDAAARLGMLREAGVGISIDDFGSGHSSLNQVLSLPATELKIDRSIVQSRAEGSQEQIASTVDLAHDRGLRVVAEGVETEEQLQLVRELGCDRVQGFLVGVPLPEAEMERLLLAQV